MLTLRIAAPVDGAVIHIAALAQQKLTFTFDLSSAQFSVEGKDLVISIADSGSIVLDGFLSLPKADLPEFALLDGTVIHAADYLNAINADLLPAAGPEASAEPASSGLGEYGSESGSLVGGIERLGSLSSIQWDRDTQVQETVTQSTASSGNAQLLAQTSFEPTETSAAVSPAAVSSATVTPATPVDQLAPVTPVTPVALAIPAPVDGEYVSRAVLYKTSAASSSSITFELLYNGQPVVNFDPATVSISSANGWPQAYFDLTTFNTDPDTGRVTLNLTEAGKLALAGSAGNLYDYVTVTVNDASYNMQLVVNKTGSFNSAIENGLEHDGFSLQDGLSEVVWGEWHNENQGSGAGQRASAGGNDIVFFQSDAGTAFNKQTFDAGDGNNTISISGVKGVYGGGISTGQGQDHIEISGGGANKTQTGIGGGATLSTGAGDDTLSVSGFIAVADAVINSGDGNDTITIVGSTAAGGRGMQGGSLFTGQGDDVISISGAAGMVSATLDTGTGHDIVNISGNLGMDSSVINANADNVGDIITITGGTDNAMQKSTLNAGDGDDIVALSNSMSATAAVMDYSSVVNLGAGNDTLTITGYKAGTNSTINANADDKADNITMRSQYSWQGGSINLGGGDDTLDMRTENTTVLNGASAGIDHSIINLGGGKDIINISGSSDAGSHTTINAGAGDTIGDVYLLEGRGNRGWYDGVINAGDGDDVFTITAKGAGVSRGEENSAAGINTGAGHDTITITAGTTGLSATINATSDDKADNIIINAGGDGLYQGIILAGDGNDHIEIHAGQAGLNSHSAYTGSLLDLGEGDNTLIVEAGSIVASTKTQIISGSGDDSIDFISHGSLVLANSSVDTGAGDDILRIDYVKDVTSPASNATHSYINMGEGNDLVMFSSTTGNLPNASLHLNGGTGEDAFETTWMDSGELHLNIGDILGFSHNLAEQVTSSTLSASKFMPNVSGFEGLLMDYSNNAGDVISLDGLLNSVDKLKDTNADLSTVIVKGDALDHMDMGTHNVREVAENVTIQNVEGQFTQYSVIHDNVEVHLLIQSTFG